MSGEDDPGAIRLRRLRMRSWRRGTKEMDLILGGYADERLAGMEGAELDLYETLLGEADDELYAWVAGRQAPPPRYTALLASIRRSAERRGRT